MNNSFFVSVLALARIVFIDGVKRNTLLGLFLFALALQVSCLFFYQFIPREILRFTIDFVLSVEWFAGFLLLLFHAVGVVAWDDNHGGIEAILARPITRFNYVVGVYTGISTLLLILNISLGLVGAVNIWYLHTSVPTYFENFSAQWLALSWFGVWVIELLLLSIVLFWSSVVRGSFPVLLLTICYYLICNGLPVVRESLAKHNDLPAYVSPLLKWLSLAFPNFKSYDYRQYVIDSAGVFDNIQALFPLGFALVYIVFFLWITGLIYNQRDLA